MNSSSGPQEGTQEPVVQGGSSAAPHQAALRCHSVVGAVCWPQLCMVKSTQSLLTPSARALGTVKAQPNPIPDCLVVRKCQRWIWGPGTRPGEKP